MKDITTTPTADLLAEINRLGLDCERYLDHVAHGLDTDGDADKYSENVKNIATIAAQLDRRTADIRNVNGFPAFSDYRQILYRRARECVVNTPLDELIERLKWLQIKGVRS